MNVPCSKLFTANFSGANLVNTVTVAVTDAIVYEYSAEDLNEIRKELLSRPACAEAVANPRNKYRPDFNGSPQYMLEHRQPIRELLA